MTEKRNKGDRSSGSAETPLVSVATIAGVVVAIVTSAVGLVISVKSYDLAKSQNIARDADNVTWSVLVVGTAANPLPGNAIQIQNRSHVVMRNVEVVTSDTGKLNWSVRGDKTVIEGVFGFWDAPDELPCTAVTSPVEDLNHPVVAILFEQDGSHWLLEDGSSPVNLGSIPVQLNNKEYILPGSIDGPKPPPVARETPDGAGNVLDPLGGC